VKADNLTPAPLQAAQWQDWPLLPTSTQFFCKPSTNATYDAHCRCSTPHHLTMMAPTRVSNAGTGRATFCTHDYLLCNTNAICPLTLLSSPAISPMTYASAENTTYYELPFSAHPLSCVCRISLTSITICWPTADDNAAAARDINDDAKEATDSDERTPPVQPPKAFEIMTMILSMMTIKLTTTQSMMTIKPMTLKLTVTIKPTTIKPTTTIKLTTMIKPSRRRSCRRRRSSRWR